MTFDVIKARAQFSLGRIGIVAGDLDDVKRYIIWSIIIQEETNFRNIIMFAGINTRYRRQTVFKRLTAGRVNLPLPRPLLPPKKTTKKRYERRIDQWECRPCMSFWREETNLFEKSTGKKKEKNDRSFSTFSNCLRNSHTTRSDRRKKIRKIIRNTNIIFGRSGSRTKRKILI